MDLFVVSPIVLGVLFLVAVLAAFIDSIAGGGGLLTVPSLLAAGLRRRRRWRPTSCNRSAAPSRPASILCGAAR